jgi:replicative DNA helicase
LRPGTFLLDLPANPPAVWGEGETVLWAQGEALMLASLPGLGKTTIAGQLVRARLGLDPAVLEMKVREGERVLWLLMDRPQQIARSILRQLERAEIEALGDRLVLGWGPPPADVARHPELLAELCASARADTLVVDSVKDAALKLTDDEVGATYNRARQLAITAGVEVLELHHLVKRNAEGKPPSSLADVYGSAWLTAGAGSVVVLTGEPGDPIVRASHLKQPREPWGPMWLAHDHARGRTTVHNRVDLLELLAVTRVQTALSAATALYEKERPSRAEVEKARRQLERLVTAGLAYTSPGRAGGEGGSAATRYHPHTRPVTELDPLGDDAP